MHLKELNAETKYLAQLLHTDHQIRNACDMNSLVTAEDVERVREYVTVQQNLVMDRILLWGGPTFQPELGNPESGQAECIFAHDEVAEEMNLTVNITAPRHYYPLLSAKWRFPGINSEPPEFSNKNVGRDLLDCNYSPEY